MEVKSFVTEYYGPRTSYYYNNFFHPNICHICKSHRWNEMILCKRCCMISYCSEEHKMEHYTEHKNICASIAKFLKLHPVCDTIRYDLHDWIKSKEDLMQFVKIDLGRELLPYEMQMFMFRKSCFICYQQTDLRTCKYCYSADFCNEHVKEFYEEHCSTCNQLVLSLNLNIAAIYPPIHSIHFKLITSLDAHKPLNTISFISQYLNMSQLSTDMRANSNDNQLIYSDYISGPLTLYYGMKEANVLYPLKTERFFIVHVIAASTVDKNSIPAWEILLHLNNQIEKLTVIMIGPELPFHIDDHNICLICRAKNKKFSYECRPMLYHNYVSSSEYKQPTIIIGFQAEFNNGKKWSESIVALRDQNCPLLLTGKFSSQMQEDLIKIQLVLGAAVKPVLNIVNRFNALRPYRDYHSGEVFYRNKYLIVFKNLRDLSEPIEASTSSSM